MRFQSATGRFFLYFGPQNDDFRRENGPPQAENFDILHLQIDDFRREIARRRRKILAFWNPENPLPDPPPHRRYRSPKTPYLGSRIPKTPKILRLINLASLAERSRDLEPFGGISRDFGQPWSGGRERSLSGFREVERWSGAEWAFREVGRWSGAEGRSPGAELHRPTSRKAHGAERNRSTSRNAERRSDRTPRKADQNPLRGRQRRNDLGAATTNSRDSEISSKLVFRRVFRGGSG